MSTDLILGTAGHIDHGKTALIRALTGVDTDRLPEERRRGITIELGFAELELPDFRSGIVDVPGHERFVRNMLAGATGMDLAMPAGRAYRGRDGLGRLGWTAESPEAQSHLPANRIPPASIPTSATASRDTA